MLNILIQTLGGLGIFILGMKLMTEGLQMALSISFIFNDLSSFLRILLTYLPIKPQYPLDFKTKKTSSVTRLMFCIKIPSWQNKLPVLAPCFRWLPGFIGPVPPPLWIGKLLSYFF